MTAERVAASVLAVAGHNDWSPVDPALVATDNE
jgi:hypothetical protein